MPATIELGPDSLQALERLTQLLDKVRQRLYRQSGVGAGAVDDLLHLEESIERAQRLLSVAKAKHTADAEDWYGAEGEERKSACEERIELLEQLLIALEAKRDSMSAAAVDELQPRRRRRRKARKGGKARARPEASDEGDEQDPDDEGEEPEELEDGDEPDEGDEELEGAAATSSNGRPAARSDDDWSF